MHRRAVMARPLQQGDPIMGKQTNSKPPKEASGKGGKKGGY